MGSISYDMDDLLSEVLGGYDFGEEITGEVTTKVEETTQSSSTFPISTTFAVMSNVANLSMDDAFNKDIQAKIIANALRILISAVGLIGNFLVMFVVLVLAEYKKSITHWYILQLSIANTLFLISLPFAVVEDLNNSWVFASWLCKAKETILFLNYYSSILFLVIMTVDRYIALSRRHSKFLKKFRTPVAAFVITLLVWVFAFVMSVPVILYSGVFGQNPNCRCLYKFPVSHQDFCTSKGLQEGSKFFDECMEMQDLLEKQSCFKIDLVEKQMQGFRKTKHSIMRATPGNETGGDIYNNNCQSFSQGKSFRDFVLFNFIAMFALPLTIMIACCSLIVMKMNKGRTDRPSSRKASTSSGSVSRNSIEKIEKPLKTVEFVISTRQFVRLTVMCGCLLLAFIICWLPFHAVHLAKLRGIPNRPTSFCEMISLVTSLLAYTNSAINPYLYNFIGSRFTRRFRLAVSVIRSGGKSARRSVYRKGDIQDEFVSSSGATKILKQNQIYINEESSPERSLTDNHLILTGKNEETRELVEMKTA